MPIACHLFWCHRSVQALCVSSRQLSLWEIWPSTYLFKHAIRYCWSILVCFGRPSLSSPNKCHWDDSLHTTLFPCSLRGLYNNRQWRESARGPYINDGGRLFQICGIWGSAGSQGLVADAATGTSCINLTVFSITIVYFTLLYYALNWILTFQACDVLQWCFFHCTAFRSAKRSCTLMAPTLKVQNVVINDHSSSPWPAGPIMCDATSAKVNSNFKAL